MTKKILLINPLENVLAGRDEMYPSGALLLLGTILFNRGYNVRIVHMLADKIGLPQIGNIISKFRPRIVGMTMSTFQTKFSKEISKIVKKINKNTLVVVGGPHPSALKLKIFDDFPCVDVVVGGEGEHAFSEIVDGKNLRDIKGICFREKTSNKVQMNEARPLAKDLDYIPLPNLDLVNFHKDRFVGVEPVGASPSMYIMASRGCPFYCSFCNKSVWGNTLRLRKPESIIQEIRWLHKKYGIKEIFFQDDTLDLNREWLEQIFNLIIENGLNRNIIYKAPFRADENLIDEELLRLAKRAGFWLIFYGVESGNQEMLDSMGKSLTISEIKRAFALTHPVGLKTVASFIIGLPGENKKTIEDTFNLWKELVPHVTGYSVAIPFPGTEFEKNVTRRGFLYIKDYDRYSLNTFVARTDELSIKELEYYRTKTLYKMKIVNLNRRLRHVISERTYFRKKIINSLKNPESIAKELKTLWKLIKK